MRATSHEREEKRSTRASSSPTRLVSSLAFLASTGRARKMTGMRQIQDDRHYRRDSFNARQVLCRKYMLWGQSTCTSHLLSPVNIDVIFIILLFPFDTRRRIEIDDRGRLFAARLA